MTPKRRPPGQPRPPSGARSQAGKAKTVEQSAKHIERATASVEDRADRRTELAADRTVLAAERTYAACVRTGLAALASGVGAKALLLKILPGRFGGITGAVLILFSALCFAAAVWRELEPGAPPPKPDTRRLPSALLLALNGFFVVADLAALVGLWVGGG